MSDDKKSVNQDDLRSLDPDALQRLAESRRRARSGRGRRRGGADEPRQLRGMVDGLLEKWGLADAVARAQLFEGWEDRVGPRVAERARPVGFDEGTLFVEVESASWLSELQMMKRQILERINAGRTRGRVEKIVFVQGGRSEGREGSGGRRGRGGREGSGGRGRSGPGGRERSNTNEPRKGRS